MTSLGLRPARRHSDHPRRSRRGRSHPDSTGFRVHRRRPDGIQCLERPGRNRPDSLRDAYHNVHLRRHGRVRPAARSGRIGWSDVVCRSSTNKGNRDSDGAWRPTRLDVLKIVTKEGFVLVVVGTILGQLMAYGMTRALSSWFNMLGDITKTSTTDPLLLFGAPILLGTLTMISCYVPARRSMRIDPVIRCAKNEAIGRGQLLSTFNSRSRLRPAYTGIGHEDSAAVSDLIYCFSRPACSPSVAGNSSVSMDR